MEGDRLIHIALREFVPTSRVSEESTATTVEIVHCLVHSLSISSKLRVRAVVWKRGAHQPGGPPLRATTARHPRSSPPGMSGVMVPHRIHHESATDPYEWHKLHTSDRAKWRATIKTPHLARTEKLEWSTK